MVERAAQAALSLACRPIGENVDARPVSEIRAELAAAERRSDTAAIRRLEAELRRTADATQHTGAVSGR